MVFKTKRAVACMKQVKKRALEKQLRNLLSQAADGPNDFGSRNEEKKPVFEAQTPQDKLGAVVTVEDPIASLRENPLLDVFGKSEVLCALCIRGCEANHTTVEAHKLENLGLTLNSATNTVCITCWKLVEMFTDFKECCLKTDRWFNRNKTMLDLEKDIWFCKEIIEWIDCAHKSIVDRSKKLDNDNLVEEDQSELITFGEIKVELLSEDSSDETQCEDVSVDTLTMDLPPIRDDGIDPITVEKLEIKTSQCKTCGRQFDSNSGRSMHALWCKEPEKSKQKKLYICEVCSASFTSSTALTFHSNKHNGIKPFKCRQQCDNHFYNPRSRTQHEKYCGHDEGFVCSVCGVRRKSEVAMKLHLNIAHSEAKFDCTVCGQIFRARRNLNRHSRVHSDERNYPCNVCGKAFKSPYAAKVHLRIHTQEKPFSCIICEQAFAYKCLLKAHTYRVHVQQ